MSDAPPTEHRQRPLQEAEPLPGNERPQIRRFQATVGAGLLLLFLSILASANLLARSGAANRWFSQQQVERAERNGELYSNVGAYYDRGDTLLLHDLPLADYSSGGVYILGSSTAIYCLDDYRLPSEQARLIHNYGINGSNLTQMYHFARFMDEEHRFLSAGGEKTMVMLGLAYINVVERDRGHAHYFSEYFSRFGVHTYSDASGITSVPMSEPERFVRTEWGRSRSFILRCWKGSGQVKRVPLDAAEFRRKNADRVGQDWQPVLRRQMADLDALLDYLKARHVEVVGFLIPEGSWNVGVPSREAFNAEAGEMFQRRGLTFLDYSRELPDADFADALHVAPSGTPKIHARLSRVAQDFLKKSGALKPP